MTSGRDGYNELEGASSLEIALDRATERYLSSVQERRDTKRGHAPPPSLPSSRPSSRPPSRSAPTTALATMDDVNALSAPLRLRWKGRTVAPELQEYAARVARGEQLAPYRGPILAQPYDEVPAREHHRTRTPVSQNLPFKQRSPLRGVWLFGVAGLIMAAIGIGSGIGGPSEDADPFTPVQTHAALTPAPQVEPTAVAPPAPAEPSLAPSSAPASSASPPSAPPERAALHGAVARIKPATPALAVAPRVPTPPVPAPAPVETVSSTMGLPPLAAVMPNVPSVSPSAPAAPSAPADPGSLDLASALDLASSGRNAEHDSTLFEAQPSF